MVKYLFTAGTNGVREVQSQQELQLLIDAADDPQKIMIWVFNSNEWLSYAAYNRQSVTGRKYSSPISTNEISPSPKRVRANPWLKKFLALSVAGAVLFLIYNFTKVRWEKASPLNLTADRPANVPLIDVDSVILNLEETRGQKLDRTTKTNLRLRNTWPDRIMLQLRSDRDTGNAGSLYYNIELAIDNTTGYELDNAVVKFAVWKMNEVSSTDTFHFNNIGYGMPARRVLKSGYRGDSISISFQSIKAKAFNFCYTSIKNNNNNINDRWFCRDSD